MRGNTYFKVIDRWAGIPLLFLSSVVKGRKGGVAPADPKRIAVLKFSALGDAILLVPSLRALRTKFPEAEVVFIGTKFTLPFLRQFAEYIDEFVPVDLERLVSRPWSIISIIRHVRALGADAALDFEQWMRFSALLACWSGAGFRAGFRTPGQHRHYTFTSGVARDRTRHEAENFLAVAGTLAAPSGGTTLEVKIDEGSLIRAQGFLKRNGWEGKMPVIMIHPGCGEHGMPREWPAERYGELIRRMEGKRKAVIIVSGTKGERAVMERVASESQRPVALYDISTIEDFAALASLASLFISSNNGAMHLVAALKIRQIALHGPTNFLQWGPLNPAAAVIRSACPQCPCLDLGFEYHRTDGYCMAQISPDEVWDKAEPYL
jgi:heptosyltransferase-2